MVQSLRGYVSSCQSSRGLLGSATQRLQVKDSTRSVSQSQSCIPLLRLCVPDCLSVCLCFSSLAIINPAVVSRLSEPDSAPSSALLSSSGVGLSLEAHTIARRYTQDRHLEGHAPSPLSASNMSVATKKYLRKNGLMEVVEEVEEEEACAERLKLRPQCQLIQQQKLVGERRSETSVGNILDLSRLRQLPKLF